MEVTGIYRENYIVNIQAQSGVTMQNFLILQQVVYLPLCSKWLTSEEYTISKQSGEDLRNKAINICGSHTATVRSHKLHTGKLHVTDGRGKWAGQNLKTGSHLNTNETTDNVEASRPLRQCI